MDLETLNGFFCALIAGPETGMSNEYLPIVWDGELPDDNAFAGLEEANAILQLIRRHWNSIIAALQTEGLYVPLTADPDERGVVGRPSARGFMPGIALRGEGQKRPVSMRQRQEGQTLLRLLINVLSSGG